MRWFRALLLSLLAAIVMGVVWFSYKDYAFRAHSEVQTYAGPMRELEEKGMPRTDFYSFLGTKLSLEKLSAKLTIVHFWASWCAPCIEEFPSLVKLAKDIPDLDILAISLDESTDEYLAFLNSLKIAESKNFKLYRPVDIEGVSIAFGVDKLPESFIFNANSKLIRKIPNAEKWEREDVQTFLRYHLEQK